MSSNAIAKSQKTTRGRGASRKRWAKKILQNWELYVMFAPVLAYFIVFDYFPLYGIQIAFKNFMANLGIAGSPWVGFTHFQRFFTSYEFPVLVKNTVGISLYQLLAGFPLPILLALMINEIQNRKYQKIVQTVTYAPHFISVVVMAGMLLTFLSPSSGIINTFIKIFSGKPVNFIAIPKYFKTIYVWSGMWQSTGWGSIIYFAALSSVDQEQIEAAIVDGAGRFRRIIHINIPAILPTAIILLILNTGRILNVGFQKALLLQNSLNMESSDIISTYVYRNGLLGAQFSFTTAVGLFNNLINCFLLVTINAISRRVSETSLW